MSVVLAILFAVVNALLAGFIASQAISSDKSEARVGLWILAGVLSANAIYALTAFAIAL